MRNTNQLKRNLMIKEDINKYESAGSPSFEVFKNALSVGWHLRKIQEADSTFMDRPEDWDKFVEWCKRHNLKK